MFRVVSLNKSVPFENYSQALAYKQENGGVIYIRVWTK